jgi:hypothetical protein
MDSGVEEADMRKTMLVRSGCALLLLAPLFGGCLITTNSDDGNNSSPSDTSGSEGATVSSFSATNVDSGSSGVADESGGSEGETTVGPTGDCSDTKIVDGGFEAGTPSTAWTEASDQFGTPICDVGCTEDAGAVPYAGDWFAWFGGVAEAEHASVSQTVTIDGTSAFLAFRFEINASGGMGDDVFTVTIDDTMVFMASDAEIADFSGYTPVSVDVSNFADGADHLVEFRSDFPGTGLSNFFLDEVSLVTCTEGTDSSGSGGSGTTAADSGSSGTGTGTGTDSGSSGGTSTGTDSGSTTTM